MILGYLAYVIVFIFGLMVGCALAAHKIEQLHQHIEQLQSAVTKLAHLPFLNEKSETINLDAPIPYQLTEWDD